MATSSSCEWSIVKRNGQLVAKRKLPKHTRARRSSNQIKSIVFPFFLLWTLSKSLTVLFNRGLQGVMKKGVAGGLIGWSDIQMFMRPSQPFLLGGSMLRSSGQPKSYTCLLGCCAFLVFAMNLSQQGTHKDEFASINSDLLFYESL